MDHDTPTVDLDDPRERARLALILAAGLLDEADEQMIALAPPPASQDLAARAWIRGARDGVEHALGCVA